MSWHIYKYVHIIFKSSIHIRWNASRTTLQIDQEKAKNEHKKKEKKGFFFYLLVF